MLLVDNDELKSVTDELPELLSSLVVICNA